MTNKHTKKALLSSALALILCFSMLVGTTFAWFTDNAVSGSNVIKSGNLDIAVQYTLDGKTWKDLDGATDLFQKGLWEPGHTEVVALRIKNNGSLALKQNIYFSFDISDNNTIIFGRKLENIPILKGPTFINGYSSNGIGGFSSFSYNFYLSYRIRIL